MEYFIEMMLPILCIFGLGLLLFGILVALVAFMVNIIEIVERKKIQKQEKREEIKKPKEMTIEEISRKLGHDVIIVKEKNK